MQAAPIRNHTLKYTQRLLLSGRAEYRRKDIVRSVSLKLIKTKRAQRQGIRPGSHRAPRSTTKVVLYFGLSLKPQIGPRDVLRCLGLAFANARACGDTPTSL